MSRLEWPAWVSVIGVVGFLGALSVPLINLSVPPIQIQPEALTGKTKSFQEASLIFQNSCLDCHSAKTRIPWYADLPVARTIITQDIMQAQSLFNMTNKLYQPGQVPSQNTLAKIEYVTQGGHMPPLKYAALHWKAVMTDDKKAVIQQWIHDERAEHYASAESAEAFKFEPVQPLSSQKNVDKNKVALGFALYHDTRLSGDNTVSCATCHDLKKGGTDQLPVSTGIRGQQGPINAPTVYNAVLHSHQFWDGRAADLKEQALGPVTNPLEMGGDWAKILPVLNADKEYRKQFNALYGGPASKEDIADAIAAFEATLITVNSPFDQYLKGDTTALSDRQKRGYEIFKSIGCVQCHTGPALGGNGFERMGVYHDYIADRGHETEVDMGRFNVTQDPLDKRAFKVPSLRNVALTFPYFHDGQVETLEDAVSKMSYYQLNHHLSVQDRDAIVAFLHSLTGEYNGQSLTPQPDESVEGTENQETHE